MDRKNKRHCAGKQTNRSDRKKRRVGPENRFVAEKVTVNTSTSEQKLNTSFDDSEVSIDPSVSYRVINFLSIFPKLGQVVNCKKCGGDVEFSETASRGLGFNLIMKCNTCVPTKIPSCPCIKNAFEVNRRLVFAMRMLGVSQTGAEKFCAFMDLPRPLFPKTYSELTEIVRNASEKVKYMSIKSAGDEEKQLTLENNADFVGLTVSGDGSWRKRGFSSLHGVVSLIGYRSKKVLDFTVKSSHCHACSLWKNKKGTAEYDSWYEEHEESCDANHVGPSGNMEPHAMVEMFQRSEQLHQVKYDCYVGDGDSKTYNEVVENVPYDVTKKECVNHVFKRMGTRLRNCKKTTKGLGGRGKLTDKIIKDLTLYYGLAIRRNMDSLENMKKAIWATFLHKSSTDSHPKHENCPEGPESWCQWQKARALGKLKGFEHKPALPQDVLDAIKPIYTDLSRDDLLKRCLGAFNQNNNESFNNVIWKFAPKTTFNGVTTVHIAANIAIIFNNGHTALLRVLEFMGVCIGMNLYDYCQKIDKERINYANRHTLANTREGRLHAQELRQKQMMDAEELLYGPGIAE